MDEVGGSGLLAREQFWHGRECWNLRAVILDVIVQDGGGQSMRILINEFFANDKCVTDHFDGSPPEICGGTVKRTVI